MSDPIKYPVANQDELEEVNAQLAQTVQLLDDITATIGEPWEVSE